MTNKALLIGINYFGTDGELRGCSNDIQNIRALLSANGFHDENITMISDDSDVAEITPTKENILTELTHFITNAKPKDTLVLHYSGHGTQVRDRNGDEPDGKDEVICTVEGNNTTGIITDDDLKEIVAQLRKGVRLFSLMDCCHSQSLLDLHNDLDSTIAGRIVELSGCMDHQTSADAKIEGTFQGAMTATFLEMVTRRGLRKVFDILFTHKNKEMREFENEIGAQLKNKGYSQIPRISFEGRLSTSMSNTFTPMLELDHYKAGTSSYFLRPRLGKEITRPNKINPSANDADQNKRISTTKRARLTP